MSIIRRGPTEAECQRTIVETARLAGWRVYHNRPTVDRYGRVRTALQGHAGFPDLVLVHPFARRVLFVELKRKPNRLQPEQMAWADDLCNAGADWRLLWVPDEMDAFCQMLADAMVKPTATVVFHDPLLVIDEAAE